LIVEKLKNKYGLFIIFALLASVGIALALFVHRNTSSISDALAAEVLEQQRDVAILLHEYDRLVLAVETERLSAGAEINESIEVALSRTEQQLEAMRFNYSFERLDGAATAHAYVKPILEDIRQWITTGIPGVSRDRQQMISIASRRIKMRQGVLRNISTETDEVASQLINTQTSYLTKFGESLMFLLGAFAMLAAAIASLLTRQRDLQFQIAEDQRQHAQRIRDFADTGADWFWEMNSGMRLRWLSGRTLSEPSAKHSAHSEDDIDRNSLPAFAQEINVEDWPMQQLRQKTGFSEFETQWVTRGGEIKTVAVSGKPLFNSAGEFAGYRGIGRDITAKKHIEQELEFANKSLIEAETRGRQQAEKALRDSEMFLRTSLNALPQNLAILNEDGIILECNIAWREYAGKGHGPYQESDSRPQAGGIGWHYEDIFSGKAAAERAALSDISLLINDVLQGHTKSLRTEIHYFLEDNTEWLAVAASPFLTNGNRYCVLAMEEVTNRKRLEERDRELRAELAHFSRLTTVGELATGLAHELNQPLTAITHNCDALLSGIEQNTTLDETDIEAIHDIHSEADRAGAIIKGLRKMVRKETGSTIETDINELVTETMRLGMADASRHGIDVELNLADDLPRPVVDAVQIQQVLMNLERNGVDAIRISNSKIRKMIISTIRLDTNFIRITVQDSGRGLDEEMKKKLFSPFQTTKNDGMGMGLSISRTIVESHLGQLWVDFSDPNMTTFHFTLPV